MTVHRPLYTIPGFASLLVLLAGPASAMTFGPDGFGWTGIDSDEWGGPTFNYEWAPNALDFGGASSATVSLPFAVDFYGQTLSSLRIHVDGVATLGASVSGSNPCPMSSAGTYAIAPHWDDLQLADGAVYYGAVGTAPNRRFVVEWYGVGHTATGGDLIFELKIFEADGHIEFHYDDVQVDSSWYSNGTSASIGLSGGSALTVACQATWLADDYAISFAPPGPCTDVDLDGFCEDEDCDDMNAWVYPGAAETCDGDDNDCDFSIDEGFDADGDGWTTCDGDCNDASSGVYPGRAELCDGIDQDCDFEADEGFDMDGDAWRTCDGDCDDFDDAIRPDAEEIADDGIDQDCDGEDLRLGDDDDDDDTPADDDDDDDDAPADDDDDEADDDDDSDGGRRGGRGASRGCSVGSQAPAPVSALLLSLALLPLLRRRRD